MKLSRLFVKFKTKLFKNYSIFAGFKVWIFCLSNNDVNF